MKKTMKWFLGFVIALALVCTLSSCASVAHELNKGNVKDEMIIAPDPDNPFQGTWMHPSQEYLHVIEGMNGGWYILNITSYVKREIYTIKETENGFVTSNNWRISVNGDILTVEEMSYERVKK